MRPSFICLAIKLQNCYHASLGELQWQAKQKLQLKNDTKVSIFLEKDGTEVDDERFFAKLSDHTRFVAKEVSNFDFQKIAKISVEHSKFRNLQISRPSTRTKIGLKIAGKGKRKFNTHLYQN